MKPLFSNTAGHDTSTTTRTARASALLGGLALVLLPACSSSSSTPATNGGTATVTGTAAGKAVIATDATAFLSSFSGTNATGSAYSQTTVIVDVSNYADACSLIQHNVVPKSGSIVGLAVQSLGGTVLPGTYTVGAAPAVDTAGASATFHATDGSCNEVTSEASASGSITLDVVSSTTVQGTFDVTMTNGDQLSGSFDAPLCAVTVGEDAGAASCGS